VLFKIRITYLASYTFVYRCNITFSRLSYVESAHVLHAIAFSRTTSLSSSIEFNAVMVFRPCWKYFCVELSWTFQCTAWVCGLTEISRDSAHSLKRKLPT